MWAVNQLVKAGRLEPAELSRSFLVTNGRKRKHPRTKIVKIYNWGGGEGNLLRVSVGSL